MKSAGILVKPIRSEDDHELALKRIAELMSAELGTPEGDELDILATLVDAYESEHFPIGETDPVTMILFCMEQQGMTRKDLEPFIGSRARVSEVLSGQRALTLPMIRRLSAGLRVPADLLIGPPSKPARAKAASKVPRNLKPNGLARMATVAA